MNLIFEPNTKMGTEKLLLAYNLSDVADYPILNLSSKSEITLDQSDSEDIRISENRDRGI